MPELPPIIIRYVGLFDYDGLYAAIMSWAKNYGYMWHEVVYKHKVPSPAGAEQEFLWIADKNVTEYIAYKIVFKVKGRNLSEIEVDVDGKKKTLTNGRMHIEISGIVTYDWQKKFGGSKMAKWLGKTYQKLYSKDLEGIYIDNLYYRLWNLQALIKNYFDMQTKKYAYKDYLAED